jgi:DNA invertase Pin-like site-specific DNA recombinase
MNRSILYLRVSRDDQVRGTSLDTQEATARDLSAREGYVAVAAYREEGESGAHYHARPQLQAALAHVERLRAEDPTSAVALVFARLDRAARDVGVHQAIERRLALCGAVQLYCDGTPGGSQPADEYARNIMRAGTQFDRAQIRARTMEAKTRRAQEGRQPSRRWAPMGYHIVRRVDVYPGSVYGPDDLGRYVVVEEEAPGGRTRTVSG